MWRLLRTRFLARGDVLLLTIVAYAPFLLSSPGRIVSDTKQALYVDPEAFLGDAAFMWDPSVAAGTVPHQRIGYLWPMGPWYWAFDQLGVPVWVAQRLWLGTLALMAALGVRWLVRSLGLGRAAALAGALVYALTPYQLAFTARMSVLLLPLAALPWMVELARRALHHGGWRHPALFGLVAVSASGVNAPAVLLVGLAPLLVLVAALFQGPEPRRRAMGAGLRIGAFLVPLSAWWISGLALQGRYGIPILETTETVEAVASRSSPDDVLRGLGNWFFYGRDRAGWSVDQAPYFDSQSRTVALSFLVPMAALAVGVVLRWRDRPLVVAAAVIATVVAVGAWPYADPSPIGRAFRWVTEQTAAGMAFRNSPRVVPVLVLALAVLLAAAIAALPQRARPVAAVGVSLLAIAGLSPVLSMGFLSRGLERPTEIPDHWTDAARHLDSDDGTTRVLELPGSDFAVHRWGNTVEPILPLMLDRPHLSREVLPQGTAGSVLLLDALDRRLQSGLLEPEAVAPIARLLGVGNIVVRSDLRPELFSLATPGRVWDVLVDPLASGLEAPEGFGDPVADQRDLRLLPVSPTELRVEGLGAARSPLPPLAVLAVSDPVDVVHLAPVDGAVVLDGDAEGILDAAAAGLIDGRELVLLAAGIDDEGLADVLEGDVSLVVTDSNRARRQNWFSSIVNTRGPTELPGAAERGSGGVEGNIELFSEATDGSRTFVEHLGATVTGSSAGIDRPEDRPVAAFDGVADTSWRIGGGDPRGSQVTARLDEVRSVDHLVVLQPQDGPRDRVVTRVAVSFDGDRAVEFDLDDSSLEPPGQTLAFPERQVGEVTVEIVGVSDPGFEPALANAVGFAEIDIDGLEVQETVVMPSDLLARSGDAGAGRELDLVMVRLRSDPDVWGRGDVERRLDRTIELPSGRSFGLVGTVRPAESAPDHLIDELLGTAGPVEYSSSGRLQADPLARASRAFDGRADTAWTSRLGDDSPPTLTARADEQMVVGTVTVSFLTDDLHSSPASVSLLVDGREVARTAVADHDPDHEGPSLDVVLEPPADTEGREVQIVVDEVTERTSPLDDPGGLVLPVTVTEVTGVDAPPAPADQKPSADCRGDLLTVEGDPIEVRLTATDDPRVLGLESCRPIRLDPGRNRVVSTLGDDTGVAVDSLTWSSAVDGQQSAPEVRGADLDLAPATITDLESGRTGVRATIDAEGAPFWFVLGQSASDGWSIRVDGATVGRHLLADGFTDAWMVVPDGPGTVTVEVTWAPQRLVWWALALSLAAAVAALAVVVFTSPAKTPPAPPRPTLRWPLGRELHAAGVRTALTAALCAGAVMLLVSRPWIAAVVSVVALLVGLRPVTAWGIAVSAPLVLAASRVVDRPELGWLAIGLLLAVVVADRFRDRYEPER